MAFMTSKDAFAGGAAIRRLKKVAVLAVAANNLTRSILNSKYRHFSTQKRIQFQKRYNDVFLRLPIPAQSGSWTVDFAGREIRIPLSSKTMWLDWDNAVSIVANDWEVKQTYENLLCSPNRPTLLFDVGANNGIHALLMAVQGLEVVAFEPNSSCIDIGTRLFSANDVQVRWEHVAIGDKNGTVNLNYSPTETYLGSVVDDKTNVNRKDLISEVVRLAPLDDYLPLAEGKRLLIKIDVEGLELQVFKGAKNLLAQAKPTVIFESNLGEREPVFNILDEYGYNIYELPWSESTLSCALTNDKFAQSRQTNFAALPS